MIVFYNSIQHLKIHNPAVFNILIIHGNIVISNYVQYILKFIIQLYLRCSSLMKYIHESNSHDPVMKTEQHNFLFLITKVQEYFHL